MQEQINKSLPLEVEQIAGSVSAEKRNEVQSILNKVFDGVSKMREQLESVVVADENDKVNMKLANTIRLGVRQVRLESEKIFDAKRQEVQNKMLSYQTEDKLWLKAKQVMQILTKEIEEQARHKEETRQRIEAERRELLIKERELKIQKVAPEIDRKDFENMTDESFDLFLSILEKKHFDKIEEEKRLEEERLAKQKAEHEERERQRIELEKLKAEREAREAEIKKEREIAEAKERELKQQREKAEAELKAERERKEKIEAELREKREQEERDRKAQEEKIEEERKNKDIAEKKARNAPDREKLEALAQTVDSIIFPDLKSDEAQKIASQAKELLTKVSNFIKDKSSTI